MFEQKKPDPKNQNPNQKSQKKDCETEIEQPQKRRTIPKAV